jgi:histone-lysine N-methyltransferase SETMAR
MNTQNLVTYKFFLSTKTAKLIVNFTTHKSALTMGKLRDLHNELLEHPPYSPDLAPSDFHLFPKLKTFLAGQRISSNQEAIAAVER